MNVMTDIWTIFGRDHGQIVEIAYRYSPNRDAVLRRSFDTADRCSTYAISPCPEHVEWAGAEGQKPWQPDEMTWTEIAEADVVSILAL